MAIATRDDEVPTIHALNNNRRLSLPIPLHISLLATILLLLLFFPSNTIAGRGYFMNKVMSRGSFDSATKKQSIERLMTVKKGRHESTSKNSTTTDDHDKEVLLPVVAVSPPHPSKKSHGQDYHWSWRSQERAFNASAHEVPSGPNPISNR